MFEAAHIVFKKAVKDRADQRNQLKDNKDTDEGDQEYISPSVMLIDIVVLMYHLSTIPPSCFFCLKSAARSVP